MAVFYAYESRTQDIPLDAQMTPYSSFKVTSNCRTGKNVKVSISLRRIYKQTLERIPQLR